ncbi:MULTISPECIES: LysR family transcriptional regulator [unclassified Bradyrhizobium]|uniref:LysR family transcriptional regulator n=1 Tax=unclassified Bradyrhizobium TaxID=2631580 RepID=UPI001CD1F413|nr:MULTISPECIES: LysR family transcriptional regulator [unclassified Bradyrhizobium]MCA1500163.1 LysR family transcriptional regulator [Bradyrhizobium sp. NBAIM14]MCA1536645.1 LysR family transcriptional regulator [Bradyrhizobium sp. NBAIM03]
MEFEDLQTFVEVARSGGVSAAARNLGVAKSIVSRRVLRLEDELSVQLLARTTRGAALTEAGLILRDHASRVCSEIEAAREEMSPSGELRGLLRIAAPASFGPTHFAPVLAELARKHPSLHVHTRYNDRYVDIVGEGFDCAIRVGYLPESDLVARRIGSFTVQLYASSDYVRERGAPKTPADIDQHQAVMIGTETWKFSEGKKTTTVHPQGRFKADNALAIAEAIAMGIGIAALPAIIAESCPVADKLVPIMTRYTLPPVGIFVVRPPGRHLARKIRVLIDLLVHKFG